MNMIVWYIHGANASPTSFAYIKSKAIPHEFEDISYNCEQTVMAVVKNLVEKARNTNKKIRIVSHSLGGVIALAVAKYSPNVEKIVTLSSPLAGCKVASLMRWLAPTALLHDIHPHSGLISEVRSFKINMPILSLVSVCGHMPFMQEPNDGVVTVASQKALTGPLYKEIDKNHFEILLSDESSRYINDFIFKD